ncbi:CidA/LrgA family protein [Nocardioides cavernaquae]|uniref:CidA/LrgA family protein n=1 Tax=Nocardioides cavernaquae TaxID=2321396 RepID=A0A3A5H683_9ACTN|nr:CidA/LrgA family protein [Nocardioides cavernaquae]RJS46173.1 CidA/LrgA family protein [Nocardioides cavernaquae]
MINGLLWLLLCQLVGEVVVRTTGLPLPGPVLGMVILFALLQLRRPPREANVFRTSDALLKHLQLLFIPAGVGVITLLGVIGDHPLPLVGALLISWVAGLVTVGWLVTLLLGKAATR